MEFDGQLHYSHTTWLAGFIWETICLFLIFFCVFASENSNYRPTVFPLFFSINFLSRMLFFNFPKGYFKSILEKIKKKKIGNRVGLKLLFSASQKAKNSIKYTYLLSYEPQKSRCLEAVRGGNGHLCDSPLPQCCKTR